MRQRARRLPGENAPESHTQPSSRPSLSVPAHSTGRQPASGTAWHTGGAFPGATEGSWKTHCPGKPTAKQQLPALGSTGRPFRVQGRSMTPSSDLTSTHASREAVHTTLGQRAQGLAGLLLQRGGSFPPPWAVPDSLVQNTATSKQDTPRQLGFMSLSHQPTSQPRQRMTADRSASIISAASVSLTLPPAAAAAAAAAARLP